MHFVIFFSITVLCGRLDAATTTKINYLPNGVVGGYELIINNTAPALKLRIPGRPPAIKQANKIVKTDNTFTRIDERIEGENVFVNIQSLITKPKEKPRYPVSAVLSVPSVRYNEGGAEENVKLTFAKIGPYAALIVPVQNPGGSPGLGNDYSIPPEIRNSIKAFIEVSDRPVSKPKNGFSYPPKSTGDPSVESQDDRGVVSRRSNKAGPYEPAKYEPHNYESNRDKEHNHIPGHGIQESKNPQDNPASRIGTVQTSKGLIITLSNKNLTLFAPNAERVVDNEKSEGNPSKLYPYGPAEANSSLSQSVAQTVKSPYHYSFSLSEQPPSVSRTVKEKYESRTGRPFASGHESGAPALFSLGGNTVSGTVAKKELLHVHNAYGLPPYRNQVGGTEQSILKRF